MTPLKFITHTLIPLVILASGVAGLGALIFLSENEKEAVPKPPAPTVDYVELEDHKTGFEILVDGTVHPSREITIGAEVAGRISEKTPSCEAGHFVSKGDVLYKIDEQDYQLEIERVEQLVKQAELELEELDTQRVNTDALQEVAAEEVKISEREHSRLKNLGKSVVSESEMDKAEQARLAAQNRWLTLENQEKLLNKQERRLQSLKESAKIQLRKAKLDLERATIKAPISGVIVNDYVEKDSFVQRGTNLLMLEDTGSIEVKCNLKVVELYWIWELENANRAAEQIVQETRNGEAQNVADPHAPRAGEDVTHSTDTTVDENATVAKRATDTDEDLAADEAAKRNSWRYRMSGVPVTVVYSLAGREDVQFEWEGRLARYDGSGVDERTRTVPCRVVVDNPHEAKICSRNGKTINNENELTPPALIRGMFVSVRIKLTPQRALLKIPEESVQPRDTLLRVVDGQINFVRKVHLVTVIEEEETESTTESTPAVEAQNTENADATNSGDENVDADNKPEEKRKKRKYWLIDPRGSDLMAGDKIVTSPLSYATEGMAVSLADKDTAAPGPTADETTTDESTPGDLHGEDQSTVKGAAE